MDLNYAQLITERINPLTVDIDLCETEEIVRIIHREDSKVASAVEKVLPEVAQAVDVAVKGLRAGGRLIYVGAGTSGRLGVLDASECPPTFGTDPGMVVGVIAGGDKALRSAIECVEDSQEQGAAAMEELQVSSTDTVVGIAASGNTPYVLGALERAKQLGAATVALCNTFPGAVIDTADIAIVPVVGPEVIMGSTRMKAGTAEKMVLNMLSTASMIKLGKVYKNLMVDISATNNKLQDRVVRIVMEAAGVSRPEAEEALRNSGGKVKPALVMLLCKCDMETAELLLKRQPNIRKTVQAYFQKETGENT